MSEKIHQFIRLNDSSLIGGKCFKILPHYTNTYMMVIPWEGKGWEYMLINLTRGSVAYITYDKQKIINFLNEWKAIEVDNPFAKL